MTASSSLTGSGTPLPCTCGAYEDRTGFRGIMGGFLHEDFLTVRQRVLRSGDKPRGLPGVVPRQNIDNTQGISEMGLRAYSTA